MVKKNTHRAGKRKREKILRAQLRALLGEKPTSPKVKPIVRVTPQIQEPPRSAPVVPLVDLTNDESAEPIPIINNVPLQFNPYYPSDDEVEFLQGIPVNDNANLEPLDPDTEFRHNVTQLFIDQEEYARSIFETTE